MFDYRDYWRHTNTPLPESYNEYISDIESSCDDSSTSSDSDVEIECDNECDNECDDDISLIGLVLT